MTSDVASPPAADVGLDTILADLHLVNPVMTASGCAGTGRELHQFVDVAQIGAVVTMSITRDARPGLPPRRMAETASGMLNAIGLHNPGVDSFLARDLPWLLQRDARPVVSIAGSTLDEYAELARRVGNIPGVAAIEVNLSSVNVESGGVWFGGGPVQAARALSVVRRDTPRGLPVFAKLSPDVASVVDVATAVVDAGADGVVLVNTPRGMHIDPDTLRPSLGAATGGLSGPAIKPLAVRAVFEVAAAMPELPIVGVGGIRTGADALEFLAAGAGAVQIGTAIFTDPSTPSRVVSELRAALAAHGFTAASQAVGVAHRRRQPAG